MSDIERREPCDHYFLVRRGGRCLTCGRDFIGNFKDIFTTRVIGLSKESQEDEEGFRQRVTNAVPSGAWYTLEDISSANPEQLTALGKSYGVERKHT